MTTETQTQDSGTSSADAGNSTEVTLEVALSLLEKEKGKFLEVVADRDKVKGKLRKLEETASSAVELQAKYDELFTERSKLLETHELTSKELSTLKTGIIEQKVSTALETAIKNAGAKAASTVLKLIDRANIQFDKEGNLVAESIEAVVKAVVESDPILFGEPTKVTPEFIDPKVKRAGTSDSSETSYAKEMKAAKNTKEITAVMTKYNVQQH